MQQAEVAHSSADPSGSAGKSSDVTGAPRGGSIAVAWDEWKSATTGLYMQPDDATDEDAAVFCDRLNEAEGMLMRTPARTPGDAAIKLRWAFKSLVDGKWGEALSFGIIGPAVERGLAVAEPSERMLWQVICDLERMGDAA